MSSLQRFGAVMSMDFVLVVFMVMLIMVLENMGVLQ